MSDAYSEKVIGALIKFAVAVIFIKFVFFGGWFKSATYSGDGFSLLPPPGWQELKDSPGVQSVLEAAEKPSVVTFAAPEKVPGTDTPVAAMSVLAVKLANPTWIDDEFPNIIAAFKQAGFRVLDHGQIQIDTLVSHWIFYQNPRTKWVTMEFYMVNDLNKLFKVQFTSDPDVFNKYRPAFEAAKNTIKFSTSLW